MISIPGQTDLFPEAHFSEEGSMRFLHLGREPRQAALVQGAMKISAPVDIQLEFANRMMAWLLFYKAPSIPKRHVMQLGLGAASLTKFCHSRLRMKTTAVEINPYVVAACREWFGLPRDDKLLQVIVADAGAEIKRPRWAQTVDVLQVDAYDQHAEMPVLDSEAFYADCRRVLTADGCLVVNIFGLASQYHESLQKIVGIFGRDCVWVFQPTAVGNTIVLAQRKFCRPTTAEISQRSLDIAQRWKLSTQAWIKLLHPLHT